VNRPWPYPVHPDRVSDAGEFDVIVLGGGISGCWAAIGARRAGARVALVEKACTIRSGASGSGCDHWESAATNPCSRITPEELVGAMVGDNDGYNNGISHYIECREGWDRVLDIEAMGGKIRDVDDEFVGAEFRDEATKLLFAYDYENRFNLRVWGTTFKKALYKTCKREGVKVFDRTMACGLLTDGGRHGAPVVGAVALATRTAEVLVFRAKATVLAMSRPTRLWLFIPGLPGLSEFRPPQCTGDGHAMAWRIGASFAMMEKSVRAEWSGDRSFPPYSTGNNHNTWYACTLVDADGREIPYLDRDGRVLTTVSERYRPSAGQKFYLKGGGESNYPSYEFRGPDTPPIAELLAMGFKPPFYADLPSMPPLERKAIWGLMVGNEGKTRIPVYRAYEQSGFDPSTDQLQSYGDGWRSAVFHPDERQLFGLPGGLLNDWSLMTTVPGLFAAGDQLYASNCHGHAAATGHYAGRHAASHAKKVDHGVISSDQVADESARAQSPLGRSSGLHWREAAAELAGLMREHCGEVKTDAGLNAGLAKLAELSGRAHASMFAADPHELTRATETLSTIENAQIVLRSCLARRASSKQLNFNRGDYPEMDPAAWKRLVVVRKSEGGSCEESLVPQDFYGDLRTEYERHNPHYVASLRSARSAADSPKDAMKRWRATPRAGGTP
jgi:succinate dehydrogenase/fumarate reductase flavoprotein subunit